MTSHKPDLPCLPSCGGRMQLQAGVKRTGFGLYVCPKCKRQAIESFQPTVHETTGAAWGEQPKGDG